MADGIGSWGLGAVLRDTRDGMNDAVQSGPMNASSWSCPDRYRIRFALCALTIGASVFAGACDGTRIAADSAQTSADADVPADAPTDGSADHPIACYPLFHACTTTDECCAPNRCLNITGTPACQQEGPRIEDAGADVSAQDIRTYPPDALFMPPDLAQADGIPKADPDAGPCSSLGSNPLLGSTLGVICFGSDPAPYQLYLTPADGGVSPGQCPTMSDFFWAGGESCGYTACGPLLGSAVAELPDAGAIIGDAGPSCCFLVARICGV